MFSGQEIIMSDPQQHYQWAGSAPGVGVVQLNSREVEEGEISDRIPSSDDDASPRSLVIDAQDQAPPSPSIDMITPLEVEPQTIFTTINAPTPPPSMPAYLEDSPSTSSGFDFPPLLPTYATPFNSQVTAPSQLQSATPTYSSLPVEGNAEEVKFVTRVEVSGKGMSPVDILCIYKFRWDQEYIEVLTRQKCAPLIPVKNLYLKAIPGLKQNVLSARISKLGIRSLVLPEPYISTVRKLGLGLNGSSHYVTISDFVKICTYFKRQAPALVGKFDFVSSDLAPSEVLHLFNDPETTSSKELLSQLSEEAVKRDPSAGNVAGIGVGSRGTNIFSHRSDGSNPDGSFNLMDVDARRLSLPNGQPLYFIVRGGMALLPNPELAKILPAVSRTAMEHIRNTYGISVEQATKSDMAMLKYLGVVSVKAGRTLLYKAVDIITMFRHWKTNVPDFVNSLAQGQIPEEKVLVSPVNYQPSSANSPPISAMLGGKRTPSPHSQTTPRGSASSHALSLAPVSTHPLHHVTASTKQEHLSLAGNHTPPSAGHASPKTVHSSSRDSHAFYIAEGNPSPLSSYSGSPAVSRTSSRDGSERSGMYAIVKNSRKAEFSYSGGHGVAQVNLASTSASSAASMKSEEGMTSQDFSSTLASVDQLGSIDVATVSVESPQGLGGSGSGEMLMPETFQLPVHMLSSIPGDGGGYNDVVSCSKGSLVSGTGSSLSASENRLSNRATMPSGGGVSVETKMRERSKRRGSSSGPLDDQTLEYSVIQWNEESLTLLTPDEGMEGYLAIPELVQKVFKSRSYISGELRTRFGVRILPASALQILTLRTRGSIEITTGNIKLVSLSDVVKLAVVGDFEVPGPVIHLLKKTCQIPLEEILSPKMVSTDHAQPPRKRGRPSSNDESSTIIPAHPDIFPLAPGWKLGSLYKVKWGKGYVVIYINQQNHFTVCLYQIYEAIFKRYVNRINFKMRMRKLKIWSSRASSLIRSKLVEVGVLPQGCSVCCLISLVHLEQLAKSYGLEPPHVLYDVFLRHVAELGQNGGQHQGQSSRDQMHSSFLRREEQASSPGLFQSEDPLQSHSGHAPSSSAAAVASQSYGIVPYLTSSSSSDRGRSSSEFPSSSSTSNLIMTSLGTKTTNQSYFPASSPAINHSSNNRSPLSLIVSIPRKHSPYKVSSPGNAFDAMAMRGEQGLSKSPRPSSSHLGVSSYSGSRGKVLQTLAKKISQKSKRHAASALNVIKFPGTGGNAGPIRPSQSAPNASANLMSSDISSGSRTCPSCGNVNPKHKKRCGICYEFLVGVNCPSCSVLNYYRAKTCFRCGTTMPSGWEALAMATGNMSHSPSSSAGGVAGSADLKSHVEGRAMHSTSQHDGLPSSRETSEGATSQPNSPSSPKYSAPPIRSAVLKSLFPQARRDIEAPKHEGSGGTAPGAAKSSGAGMGMSGGVAPTRECPECGYLNTRMAKKCVRCKGHLQGRACIRCSRPNLNHVTECYKCGANLPPASSKYVYVGSHSGRAYKSVAITETIETKLLLSKAPITCIRCNTIRGSGFFKCSRCGDAFKAEPVITPGWEKGMATSSKKAKNSEDEATLEKSNEIDSSLLSSFAAHILTLGFQEHLTPLFRATEDVSRQQLSSAQEELEAADSAYQAVLGKRLEAERKFLDHQASVDAAIIQMETYSKKLEDLCSREEECQRLIADIPAEIETVKSKMEAYNQLMMAD